MRFFEFRKEVKVFLKEREYDHAKETESKEINQILAYLSDIFSSMNNLSVSMQGKNINKLKCCEVLNNFKEKLHLWCRRVKRGNLTNFPSLEKVTDEEEFLITSVCEEIINH